MDAWLKTCRTLICEAYHPPFYPSFDYKRDRAVKIATEVNSDSMRYPAPSDYAYFLTKSGDPVHPELTGDSMRETVDACKKAGLKVVTYVPHPFMDATSKDPRYQEWNKKFADGTPMTTEHYGFAKYFEGCLNSPVRDATRDTVLLPLLADTGNTTKKLRIREEFLPVEDVKVRIRVPDGRTVKSVSLLRRGAGLPASAAVGWLEVTVPRALIHEAVRVDLA